MRWPHDGIMASEAPAHGLHMGSLRITAMETATNTGGSNVASRQRTHLKPSIAVLLLRKIPGENQSSS